jgi:hypothetical protein
MDQLYAHRAFANRGRNTLGAPAAYIADGKDSGNGCLEVQRGTGQGPAIVRAATDMQVEGWRYSAPNFCAWTNARPANANPEMPVGNPR